MKAVLIIGCVLVALLCGSYLYLRSDVGLLGDEILLEIVSADVLGKRPYDKTCPRSSYAKDVEIPAGPNKGATAYFKFYPIPGMEVRCPPVSLLVDRRTAETWIGDSHSNLQSR